MSDKRGDLAGLWDEKVRAALFLASYAALKGLKPVVITAREEVGNLYSVQAGAGDVGELAVFHLLYGESGTLDATLRDTLPGLIEAGAAELEDILRGPDPVGGLMGLLGGNSMVKKV